MSRSLRLPGGQRGRVILHRGRDHRGRERTHGGRQLDGGASRGHRAPRHVPRLLRAHAAGLARERQRYIVRSVVGQ